MSLFAFTINYTKTARMPITDDQLRGVFKKFDTDGDKKLSKDELKAAFEYLGSYIPGWQAFLGLQLADANRDGFVNEDELNALVAYASKFGYLIK